MEHKIEHNGNTWVVTSGISDSGIPCLPDRVWCVTRLNGKTISSTTCYAGGNDLNDAYAVQYAMFHERVSLCTPQP